MVAFSFSVFADKVIVKEEEVGYPIVVEKDTYTVSNPSYYYYSGHRCYREERPDLGVSVLGLHAGIGGSDKIYCYPYP